MGYRGKTAEQERARQLRATGRTLADIAAELGVSRSSVSLWVRDVMFEPRPRTRARRRGPNTLERRKLDEVRRLLDEGAERIGELSEREFLVAGAALYAGEGAKRDGKVKFTNSDPRMAAFFCAWLRTFFPIDEQRLRVHLYLHEGLDLDAAIDHWSTVLAIPAGQFSRPYRAVPDAGIRHSRHVHGCVSVGYSCSATHRAVMGLVHALLGPRPDPG